MVNYLTENTLIEFLRNHSDSEGVSNKNFLKHRFRPDFVSHKKKLVVEFDGYHHYTKSKVIYEDRIRDDYIREAGYTIIRIPYFVQLCEKVIKNEFSDFIEIFPVEYSTYSHGFISENCVLPADFCTLGLYRLKKDMERFSYIQEEITHSLYDRSEPEEQVLPTCWYNI